MPGLQPQPFTYAGSDGLPLAGADWNPPGATGLPLVCLPGMTRCTRDFADLAAALVARGRRVIALDLRGRGRSSFAPVETYTPAVEAADVRLALKHLGLPRAAFLGTSRGGLVMMTLSLVAPELIAAAILNDIGPVIEHAGLVRIAGYIGRPLPASWPAAVAALKAGQGALFPALDAAGWERYARQIYRDDNGVPANDYDSALEVAFGAFDPKAHVPDFWPGFDALAAVPVLSVHGALSDILSPATVAAMAARHPGLEAITVASEGHAPLLWDEETQSRIAAFLAVHAG
ncbi:alpha/beta fold hydrolase [Pseudoxanthobacter sp.]|uniref:alpha/beta fold hydrolase n=1 Tax=Pseudoxanthobacter sp. TaxID=1925742 RepID=UPI002FE31B17